MGQTTGIAYVDHTRNYWTGCQKIGPGCDGCYAEAFQRWTRGKDPETGQAKNWGPKGARIPHLEGASRDVRRWNRQAREYGVRRRVFINTQSDTFDNQVPQIWRERIWLDVEDCPHLEFLFVTKRIGNVQGMVPDRWLLKGFPPNFRLLITIVNQEEASRDLGKLRALPCKNGVSYEPALGPVDWCEPLGIWWNQTQERWENTGTGWLQWIIVGGESNQAGHRARPFDIEWARSTIRQCKAAGVPPFIKQLGSHCIGKAIHFGNQIVRVPFKDPAGTDPSEWAEDLRVREYPV